MHSFFFLLTGATGHYHTIYLVFAYFASFTDYEDDIFEVVSNLHFQGSKFGGKIYRFGEKFERKKSNSTEFTELVFPGLSVSQSIQRQSRESLETDQRQSRDNESQSRDRPETLQRQSRDSQDTVQRQSRHSPETVQRQFRDSPETV